MCKEASILVDSSFPCAPTLTFYKLLEIERTYKCNFPVFRSAATQTPTTLRPCSRKAIRDTAVWRLGSAAVQDCSRWRRHSYCSQATYPAGHCECHSNPIRRGGPHYGGALSVRHGGTGRCRYS